MTATRWDAPNKAAAARDEPGETAISQIPPRQPQDIPGTGETVISIKNNGGPGGL